MPIVLVAVQVVIKIEGHVLGRDIEHLMRIDIAREIPSRNEHVGLRGGCLRIAQQHRGAGHRAELPPRYPHDLPRQPRR